MSTRTKSTIVATVERLGLAVVAVFVLWNASRSDSAEARENDRQMRSELLSITREMTQATAADTELKRQRLIQDGELERALEHLASVSERQTSAIEALIKKLDRQ